MVNSDMTGSDKDNTDALGFDGKQFARELTTAPGVYRMHAADDSLLYVGKASSLKKRVASYFTSSDRPLRQRAALSHSQPQ